MVSGEPTIQKVLKEAGFTPRGGHLFNLERFRTKAGTTYQDKGDLEQAEAQFRQVLEEKENYVPARIQPIEKQRGEQCCDEGGLIVYMLLI